MNHKSLLYFCAKNCFAKTNIRFKSYFDRYNLSPIQRIFLTGHFAISGFVNPYDGNYIAGLGDVTSTKYTLNLLKEDMLKSELGQRILKEKPLITEESLNFKYLQDNKSTDDSQSFGNSYFQYMNNHSFSPNERSIVRFTEDEELAYVLIRYRQVHDFWHVLSGLPPTVFGEVVLKCFEFEVTGLPVALLGGTVGQFRLSLGELGQLYKYYLPWVKTVAKSIGEKGKSSYNVSSPGGLLLSYSYEENLHKSVERVREELGFLAAPAIR